MAIMKYPDDTRSLATNSLILHCGGHSLKITDILHLTAAALKTPCTHLPGVVEPPSSLAKHPRQLFSSLKHLIAIVFHIKNSNFSLTCTLKSLCSCLACLFYKCFPNGWKFCYRGSSEGIDRFPGNELYMKVYNSANVSGVSKGNAQSFPRSTLRKPHASSHPLGP